MYPYLGSFMVTMSLVALKNYDDFTGDFFGIYLDMLWDIDGIFSQEKFTNLPSGYVKIAIENCHL